MNQALASATQRPRQQLAPRNHSRFLLIRRGPSLQLEQVCGLWRWMGTRTLAFGIAELPHHKDWKMWKNGAQGALQVRISRQLFVETDCRDLT